MGSSRLFSVRLCDAWTGDLLVALLRVVVTNILFVIEMVSGALGAMISFFYCITSTLVLCFTIIPGEFRTIR